MTENITPQSVKICKKCNQQKPTNDFKIVERNVKDGKRKYYNSNCNDCVKQFHKIYYKKVCDTPIYKERKKKNYKYTSTGKPRGRPRSVLIDLINNNLVNQSSSG